MCAARPPRPTPCSHLAYGSVAARCGAFPPWGAPRARPAAGRRVGQRNALGNGLAVPRRSVPHSSALRALAHSACHPDCKAQPARPPHTAARSAAASSSAAGGQRMGACPSAAPPAPLPSALAVWGVTRPAHPPALDCSGAGAQTSGDVQPAPSRWSCVSCASPVERPRIPRPSGRGLVACRYALPWRGCGAVAPRGSAPRHVPPAPASAPLSIVRGQPASAGAPRQSGRGLERRVFSLFSSSLPPPPRGGPRPAWRPRSAGSPAPPLRSLRVRSVCRRRARGARRLRTSHTPRSLTRVRCPCPPPRPLPLGGGGCACPPSGRYRSLPGGLWWLGVAALHLFASVRLRPSAGRCSRPLLLGACKISNTLVFSPNPIILKVRTIGR